MTFAALDAKTYRRRANAWAMYDWANSAFFTTILAAVLPTYYSAVAGSTLASSAIATRNWSLSLSLALFISALISPVLGTLSDIARNKKVLLAFFTGIGVIGTGLMVLIGTGDWVLASVLIVIARFGAAASNVFYDALLPHVAKPEDQDEVSNQGYALGYLGGGLLLAINVVMINVIPDDVFGFPFDFAGIRLSFASVAVWWTVFSIPLLRQVPEPQTANEVGSGNVIVGSFKQLGSTLREIRNYSELFKFLIAFLIYNDGIGTIIGVAAIYGAELGFATTELILALLLVQFVGIPFSLIFGRLPEPKAPLRKHYLAYILFNVVGLLLVAGIGRFTLPMDVTGASPGKYVTQGEYVGEGVYNLSQQETEAENWVVENVDAALLDTETDIPYLSTTLPNSTYSFLYYGQDIVLMYATSPTGGMMEVKVDGKIVKFDDKDGDDKDGIDTYSETNRYDVTETIEVESVGTHELTLTLVTDSEASLAIRDVTVLPAKRTSNLVFILGLIGAVQVGALLFTVLGGAHLVSGLAETLTTKRSILLSLFVYSIIAIWGYFVDSSLDFWLLAWMVGIVQGGSQALSRSLYAALSPASKSGEFFGFFSTMSKFSSITGPLIFAAVISIFGNSRPAVLSLIALFIVGGVLLAQVDVQAGKRHADEDNSSTPA